MYIFVNRLGLNSRDRKPFMSTRLGPEDCNVLGYRLDIEVAPVLECLL